MSRSTISTFKLFELFPDEASARKYLESRLWPNGVICPECKSGARITTMQNRPGYYRCNACKLDFTVRTGTIFERSHVPLHKWLCDVPARYGSQGHLFDATGKRDRHNSKVCVVRPASLARGSWQRPRQIARLRRD